MSIIMFRDKVIWLAYLGIHQLELFLRKNELGAEDGALLIQVAAQTSHPSIMQDSQDPSVACVRHSLDELREVVQLDCLRGPRPILNEAQANREQPMKHGPYPSTGS
jgi:hypothetical protein